MGWDGKEETCGNRPSFARGCDVKIGLLLHEITTLPNRVEGGNLCVLTAGCHAGE